MNTNTVLVALISLMGLIGVLSWDLDRKQAAAASLTQVANEPPMIIRAQYTTELDVLASTEVADAIRRRGRAGFHIVGYAVTGQQHWITYERRAN